MGGEGGDGQLREQLRDLGAYLLELAEGPGDPAGQRAAIALAAKPGRRADAHVDDRLRLRNVAREEYRRRRARAEHFDTSLFSEPAWDMLLDLYVAHVDDLRISVTSACLASSCPPTTALRWVAVLEAQELVMRVGDRADQRRTWVTLTTAGIRQMEAYLRAKASAPPLRGSPARPTAAKPTAQAQG